MSGETPRHHEEAPNQPIPAGATTGGQRADEDRVGPYGGDDGALEHERAEMAAPETLTPEETGSKVAPSRQSGR